MLNLRKGHVFVELNYPHIIGFWGYERHHDVARMTSRSRPTDVHQSCQIEPQKLQGKQWRTKGKTVKDKPVIRATKPVKARASNAEFMKARVLKALPTQPPMRQ